MYPFELWFSPDICPGVRLLDHMTSLFLVLKGSSILFSIVTATIYIPNNNLSGFSFLHTMQHLLFEDLIFYFIYLCLTVLGFHCFCMGFL